MKLSFCTDSLGNLPFETMLDKLCEYGVQGVEMTGGGWSSAPHVRVDELLASAGKRKAVINAIESRGLQIAALNVSGNPLDPGELGAKHKADTDKTIELAGLLGVKKIVMMSGLPPAAPGDKIPNWITYTVSWPPTLKDALDYQWNDVAIPYWHGLVTKATAAGVERFALENFSSMLVWSPETLFRLRDAVGPMVGLNLDPSHLFWMGADPIASARALSCNPSRPRQGRALGARACRRQWAAGNEAGGGRRAPRPELCRRRLRARPAMVEGVLFGRPDDGPQRLGFA